MVVKVKCNMYRNTNKRFKLYFLEFKYVFLEISNDNMLRNEQV